MNKDEKRAASSAMVIAFTLIATHVTSRAARDSLFLEAYDVSSLPWMVMGSAVVSAMSVVLTASALRRFGPLNVLRAGSLVSGLLFVVESILIDRFPRTLPVVAFLHITSLGALVISAFWSMINERFDPRNGRRVIVRTEALAALGGVIGGLSAERLVAATTPSALLVLAAALCGVAFCASMFSPGGSSRVEKSVQDNVSAIDAVRDQYVRRLAAIVLLVALSSTLLDYAFKAEATRSVSSSTSLARVFAIYHTVVGVLTFLIQSFVGPWVLRTLGPAGASGSLPATVGGVGLFAVFFPGFWSIAVTRGLEAVMQNSFYRSGYELFFIPIDPALKRKAKAALDVGVDKFGDSVGAALTLLLVAIWTEPDQRVFIALAMLSSGATAWFIFLVRKSYISALGDRLKVTQQGPPQSGSLSRLSLTAGGGDYPLVALGVPPDDVPKGLLARKLRSQTSQLRKDWLGALKNDTFDLNLAALLVGQLEDDEARPAAEIYLERHVKSCVGLLTDALLDQNHTEKLRRRIPRILRGARDKRAAAGLLLALDDKDFEVRFRAGIALGNIIERYPSAKLPPEIAFEKAREALEEHHRAWEEVMQIEDDEIQVSVLDSAARKHYNKGLQHVFEILGLCLERHGLRRALHALWDGNKARRGTALEYLGEVLPLDLRKPLWPKLKIADQLPPPRRNSKNSIPQEAQDEVPPPNERLTQDQ